MSGRCARAYAPRWIGCRTTGSRPAARRAPRPSTRPAARRAAGAGPGVRTGGCSSGSATHALVMRPGEREERPITAGELVQRLAHGHQRATSAAGDDQVDPAEAGAPARPRPARSASSRRASAASASGPSRSRARCSRTSRGASTQTVSAHGTPISGRVDDTPSLTTTWPGSSVVPLGDASRWASRSAGSGPAVRRAAARRPRCGTGRSPTRRSTAGRSRRRGRRLRRGTACGDPRGEGGLAGSAESVDADPDGAGASRRQPRRSLGDAPRPRRDAPAFVLTSGRTPTAAGRRRRRRAASSRAGPSARRARAAGCSCP